MTELFPYQIEGAKFLSERATAFLGDDPGLGKSAQAIEACNLVGAKNAVVVCPASLVTNWQREFARFGRVGTQVTVVSYNKAQTHADKIPEADVLILDEVHYLKSHKAKRTMSVYGKNFDGRGGLVSKYDHVWVMSGTPVPNNYSELWTHIHTLYPIALIDAKTSKPVGFWGFTKRYCVVREIAGIPSIIKSKPGRADELMSLISPWFLRRRKTEVLKDLPAMRFEHLYVDAELKAYHSDKPGYEKELALLKAAIEQDGAAALQKLAPHSATVRRYLGYAKITPVVKWLENFLLSTEEKIVIFGHHSDVLQTLFAHAQAQTKTAYIDGKTQQSSRQAAVDAFQNDPETRVFIGQIQAAGTGLTLTAASTMLIVEPSWVPADNAQAAMRIHRIGQKNACICYFITIAETYDERIQEVLRQKTQDIAALME